MQEIFICSNFHMYNKRHPVSLVSGYWFLCWMKFIVETPRNLLSCFHDTTICNLETEFTYIFQINQHKEFCLPVNI